MDKPISRFGTDLLSQMKKSFPKILLVLVCSILLSACSLLPIKKSSGPVTLKVWGLWESATTMNLVIDDYKKEHPNVNVIYEKKSIQQYRESLQAQIQAGKGPDVLMFHNTWTPMLKNELTAVPANVISASDFKTNYFPTVINDLRNTSGSFVGVPAGIDGLGLYWNQDIFNAAGIVAPPTTWQELAQVAAKLTVRDTSGNIRTAGAALGTASNVDQFSDILGLMIMQNGGDLKKPTSQLTADALDYYTRFAKGQNRVWDETMPSSTIAFAGGNLAMYFGPSWRAAEIKQANPLLNFKVAPVPQLEGGKLAWASYWAYGVSSKSSSQQAAWDFVKYLEDDQTLIKLYSEDAKTPGMFFGEPYPKISLAQKLSLDPIVGAYVTDAPYMRSFPMASRTFDNGLNDQIIKAYEDAVNKVLSGTSASSALSTTATNVANILNRYGAQ